MNNITPQEAWTGYKPNVAHLKVFVSVAYGHVPEQKRKKLDDRSAKYIFVGYDSRSKAYKLYDPIEGKLHISRDVQFDETALYFPTTSVVEEDESGAWPEVNVPSSHQRQAHKEDEFSNSTPRILRTRSARELYGATDGINLLCLFADCEPISYKEAVKEKR